jgi:hypothetical protein
MREGSMRFYFDVSVGTAVTKDDQGSECADRDAARCLALEALTEIAADEIVKTDPPQFAILVRDDAGKPVLSTRLKIELSWLG